MTTVFADADCNCQRLSDAISQTAVSNDAVMFSQALAGLSVDAADVVETPWFDLRRYANCNRVYALKAGLASPGEVLDLIGSFDGETEIGRLCHAQAPDSLATNAVGAAEMVTSGIPLTRYVKLRYTNGATVQTSLKLLLSFLSD